MGHLLLGIVELFSLCTSIHGLVYITCDLESGFFATFHNCFWFVFAILSNAFGLGAIAVESYEGRLPTGGLGLKTLQALQYHYFFSWMNILVGYAALVTETWMTYYPFRMSHLHLALVGIPIVAWLKRKSTLIVITTQVITMLAIVSHAYISIGVGNWWSLLSTFIIMLQIIAMSLPVRFTFFVSSFSTREAAILLGGIASLVFPKAITVAAQYHHEHRDRMPRGAVEL